MFKAYVLFFVLLLGSQITEAATITAASCSYSAVQSAVNSAPAGSIIQVPAGDCNWGASQLNVPGGIHIKGAGKTATTIRRGASVPQTAFLINFNCSNGLRATLSDVTMVGYNNSSVYDKGVGLNNGCIDFRVYNSKFTHFAFAAIYVSGSHNQRGVIHNNEFIDNYVPAIGNLGYGVAVYGGGTWPALELGTQNTVFIEDNYMSGQRHHVASNNGSRYVFRYNTAIANDFTKNYPMADTHGKSSSPRGSRSFEIYNNKFSAQLTSGRVLAAAGIRGGDGVIFNNTVGTGIANAIFLTAEGFNCGTYPGIDQTRSLHIWNNNSSVIRNDCASSIQLGRDYFTAPRPNYTPYTYPHPLRGVQPVPTPSPVVTPDNSFSLVAQPTVVSLDTTSVAIRFELSVVAQAQIQYGKTKSYGSYSTLETSFNYSRHRQVLSNLTPGTTYHYRVLAKNAAGEQLVSMDSTFTTLGTPPCQFPNWQGSKSYVKGDIVRFTDGKLYIAEYANPGYSPTISTWYWNPYTCTSK